MATVTVWRAGTISTPLGEEMPSGHTCRGVESVALTVGRVLFGGFFLRSGWNHWNSRQMMSGYASSKGVPAPTLAVVGSGAMVALGGLSLLLGVKPKVGAGLIAGFLAGVTPVMHAFWKDNDPQQRMNNEVQFMKNIALLGGAALAASLPEPWPYSLGNQGSESGV